MDTVTTHAPRNGAGLPDDTGPGTTSPTIPSIFARWLAAYTTPHGDLTEAESCAAYDRFTEIDATLVRATPANLEDLQYQIVAVLAGMGYPLRPQLTEPAREDMEDPAAVIFRDTCKAIGLDRIMSEGAGHADQ